MLEYDNLGPQVTKSRNLRARWWFARCVVNKMDQVSGKFPETTSFSVQSVKG